jgi:hypothetical protein
MSLSKTAENKLRRILRGDSRLSNPSEKNYPEIEERRDAELLQIHAENSWVDSAI